MLRRLALALTTALLAGLSLTGSAAVPQKAVFVGAFHWRIAAPWFGGFSGLEISPDGTDFAAITDKGWLVQGRIERRSGRIAGVSAETALPLRRPDGAPLPRPMQDSEGLALGPGGDIFVSYEGRHRVWAHDATGRATERPRHPDFRRMISNSSLEALAVDGRGRLVTIPERSGRLDRPFPVYRLEGAKWRRAFAITRDAGLLVVGADFGPDGRLYVLEREFTGLSFRSRIRAFVPRDGAVLAGERLLETRFGRHANLEGLAVWRDAAGRIRLTMIADNNFKWFLGTELVEYMLPP